MVILHIKMSQHFFRVSPPNDHFIFKYKMANYVAEFFLILSPFTSNYNDLRTAGACPNETLGNPSSRS